MVCLTLMLWTINSLVKFAQLHNIFVFHVVAKMKIYQDVFTSCMWTMLWFSMMIYSKDFIGSINHERILLKWVINSNIGINHLEFEFNDQHLWMKHMNMEIGVCSLVIHETYSINW
jgi:hypothetical protein